MYLVINGVRHAVSQRIVCQQSVTYISVDPAPNEISGIVQMFRDDGFLLSEDDASAFERKLYEENALTMTNEPEPPEIVVPDEPVDPDDPFATSDDIINILLGVNE